MTTKQQQHVSRFLEAPVVRMLRIRLASLKINFAFLCSKDAQYIGGFLKENILQQIRFFSPFRHPQGHP